MNKEQIALGVRRLINKFGRECHFELDTNRLDHLIARIVDNNNEGEYVLTDVEFYLNYLLSDGAVAGAAYDLFVRGMAVDRSKGESMSDQELVTKIEALLHQFASRHNSEANNERVREVAKELYDIFKDDNRWRDILGCIDSYLMQIEGNALSHRVTRRWLLCRLTDGKTTGGLDD